MSGAMAVIFDLGAVLFRWQPAALLQKAAPHLAQDATSAEALAARFFQSFHVGSDWAEFDRGTLDEAQVVTRLTARLALARADVQAIVDAIPDHLALRDDTVALVRELHAAGHRLYYLSNMPRSLIAHVDPRLQAMGCFIDGIYSSDVGMVKPEVEIFELAQLRFALAAADICFLDDNRANVAAARALGWQAWEFIEAAGARRDLAAAGVEFTPAANG